MRSILRAAFAPTGVRPPPRTRDHGMINRLGVSLVVLMCQVMVWPGGIALAAEPVAAQWEVHQLKFRYHGFTTDYTCEGIKAKLRQVLRAIGARDDVKVTGACGGDPRYPQPFHNLVVAFAIAVPAEEGAAMSGETFPARWQEVRLGYNQPRDLSWGDCELIEQFRDQVLPLVPLQGLDDRTRCVPGRHNVGSPSMTLTVLTPTEAPAIPMAPAAPAAAEDLRTAPAFSPNDSSR
jgi:hypothetical protein